LKKTRSKPENGLKNRRISADRDREWVSVSLYFDDALTWVAAVTVSQPTSSARL
jgi:hypothetical protein